MALFLLYQTLSFVWHGARRKNKQGERIMTEKKIDKILVEIKSLRNDMNTKFEQVDKKFEQVDKKF